MKLSAAVGVGEGGSAEQRRNNKFFGRLRRLLRDEKFLTVRCPEGDGGRGYGRAAKKDETKWIFPFAVAVVAAVVAEVEVIDFL